MWEFLQANSTWIMTGLFVLVMLFMHGGMGHGAHTTHGDEGTSGTQAPFTPPADDAPARSGTSTASHATVPEQSSTKHGCH